MRRFLFSTDAGMFTVPGPVALPQLSMSDITVGTIDDARLSANVALLDAAQTLTNKTIDTADNAITVAQADVTGLTASLALKLDAASYTAADVLTKLLTVDGTGSGLDADLLDGNSVAAFGLIGSTNTWTGAQIFTSNKTTITTAQPRLALIETDAPAGTTNYEIIVSAGSMIRRMMNDDNTFGANFEVLTRSANVITNWSMVATVVTVTGNVSLGTAGNKLLIKEGSNASMGVATLVGGTVTVSNTLVTAGSRIFLTVQSLGTVTAPKAIAVTARTAATSFVITSADATDTSVVAWHIIEPA